MGKFTKQEWSELKQLLAEGGCPILQEESDMIVPVGLKIEQVPSLGVNRVFDLENGQAGFVMDLTIANESDRPIRIQGFQLKTGWEGAGISLLPGPDKSGIRQGNYCFPGSGPLAFDREIVLNRFILGREKLNAGLQKRGLFLGIENSPIPCHYPEYGRTVLELNIFDTTGNKYSSEVHLCIDRSVSCAQARREEKLEAELGRALHGMSPKI